MIFIIKITNTRFLQNYLACGHFSAVVHSYVDLFTAKKMIRQ